MIGEAQPRLIMFLEIDLTDGELERVAHKSGFAYMKENEAYFEMVPPNLFSVSGSYLKSGRVDRHKGVSTEISDKIADFCRQRAKELSFPLEGYYPDL